MIALYLDENVDDRLAAILSGRGHDVLTARDAGKLGLSDEEQLAFATSLGRVILTHDIADFVQLHRRHFAERRNHSGIIVANDVALGELARRLENLVSRLSQDDVRNQLRFLEEFKED